MTTRIAVIIFILMGSRAVAQGPVGDDDIDARMDEARLVETAENDPAAAAALYELIANEKEVSPERRTKAWLRLGLCYRRIGNETAARRALEAAAQGMGSAAKSAQDALAGKNPDGDPRLAARVHRAIAKLHFAETSKEGASELGLIAAAAVPYIADAIEHERNDLAFSRRAVAALLSIGGESSAAVLRRIGKSEDTLFRRTVVRGFFGLPSGHSSYNRDPMRAAICAFLADPDEQLRLEVASWITLPRMKITDEEIFALAADPSPRIRKLVYERGTPQSWGWRFNQSEAKSGRVVNIMRKGLADADRPLIDAMFVFLRRTIGRRTRVGFDFLLELLSSSDPKLQAAAEAAKWFDGSNFVNEIDKSLSPTAKDLLQCARQLSPEGFGKSPQRARRENTINIFVQRISASRWTSDQLEDVIELIRHGVDGDCERWIMTYAHKEHVMALAENIDIFPSPPLIASKIAALGPPPAASAPLLRWVQNHEEEIVARKGRGRSDSGLWNALVACGETAAVEAMVEMVIRHPALHGLVAGTWRTKELSSALRARLLTAPLEGQAAGRLRSRLFAELIREGDPSLTSAFAAAYRLGFISDESKRDKLRENLIQHSDSVSPGGIGGLAELKAIRESAYDGATLARIFDECLSTGVESAWMDLLVWLPRHRNQARGRFKDLPVEVWHLFLRRALDAPVMARRRMFNGLSYLKAKIPTQFRELCARALGDPDLPTRRQAIDDLQGPFDDAEVKSLKAILNSKDYDLPTAVLQAVIRAGDRRFIEIARSALAHENEHVRGEAIRLLVSFLREEAVPDLVKQLKDLDAGIRVAVCGHLAAFPDRQAVPALIDALKDPSSGVRKAAQAALARIQFYYDQTARWQHWLEGTGLEGMSAAEALLEQASSKSPKKIRLIAIQSLGTLGVAETLPVLITMMQDKDPDIAAAAAAAVGVINARKN